MKRTTRSTRNKYDPRKRLTPTLAAFRSAVTNGSRLLDDVDGRSAWMRRYRDCIAAHEADLGGHDLLSEGQRAIVRTAALLQCQLEKEDAKIAQNNGEASLSQIETYQRASNSLRRLLESLGLNVGRRARTVEGPLTLEAIR